MPVDSSLNDNASRKSRVDCARAEYASLWRGLVQSWQTGRETDAAWLTYSANYLLNTAGVRWALDPLSLFSRLGGGQQPDFRADLECLQMVVLSHAHNDHLDLKLIAAIRDLPVTWVIPAFMLDTVMREARLPAGQIIVPQAGQPIRIDGLTLIPFDGQHFRGANGVPEMGYTAEFAGKRWLFPGDTRTYAAERLPQYNQLDGVVAHLWLGKGCAQDRRPPLLDDFCRFVKELAPAQVAVTHLDELGRDDQDLWTLHHYELACSRLKEIAPEIRMRSARMGQCISLG